MTDLEIMKLELTELRARIDVLETRLDTRIGAVEAKEQLDFAVAEEKQARLGLELQELKRQYLNLASLHRAGQMAVLHLLGVTARAVRVSEAEISEAMKMAATVTP